MTSLGSALSLRVLGQPEPLVIRPDRLVVAGYTGRDEQAVAAHIQELAAIGVPRPTTVPVFWDLDPALLTTAELVEVRSGETSGEVEPVLIRHEGRHYLAVGSDHTDRRLERRDIAAAKATCPKPVGPEAAALGPDLAALDWDALAVSSWADDRDYQHGVARDLRHPAELLELMTAVLGEETGDLLLFCGTVPLLGGEFHCGSRWRVRLRLASGEVLTHTYEAKQRSL